MSRSRDYVEGVPVEIAERIRRAPRKESRNKTFRKRLSQAEIGLREGMDNGGNNPTGNTSVLIIPEEGWKAVLDVRGPYRYSEAEIEWTKKQVKGAKRY